MGNPFRRIESPASTAVQVIEAHRLFHLVTVIVHGKVMTSISTHIICRQIAVLWLCKLRKQCTTVRIASLYVNCNLIAALILQLTTLIDLTCCFFYFKADDLPSRKFCFLTSSQKLVFAISSRVQLNFMHIFSF